MLAAAGFLASVLPSDELASSADGQQIPSPSGRGTPSQLDRKTGVVSGEAATSSKKSSARVVTEDLADGRQGDKELVVGTGDGGRRT